MVQQKEERIVNYGSHVRELLKLGIKQSMKDIFYNLNHEHLSKQHPTIHEILNEKGIQSASINALLYRGKYSELNLKIPFLLSVFTGLKQGDEVVFTRLVLLWRNAQDKPIQKELSFGKSMDSTIHSSQMN